MTYPKALAVFCGASNNAPQKHLDLGSKLGEEMAKHHIRLVYGGGDCGIMGAVANAVMQGGGKVTGVFPESLKNIENEHQGISEIVMVETMHQRKELMYQRSEAFAILPGGFGTMDEMFEILTWKQLLMHEKPIYIVNYDNYWGHLVALMDNIINEGFADSSMRDNYTVVSDVAQLMEHLSNM